MIERDISLQNRHDLDTCGFRTLDTASSDYPCIPSKWSPVSAHCHAFDFCDMCNSGILSAKKNHRDGEDSSRRVTRTRLTFVSHFNYLVCSTLHHVGKLFHDILLSSVILEFCPFMSVHTYCVNRCDSCDQVVLIIVFVSSCFL